MNARDRALTARLMEKLEHNPEYVERLKLEIKEVKEKPK